MTRLKYIKPESRREEDYRNEYDSLYSSCRILGQEPGEHFKDFLTRETERTGKEIAVIKADRITREANVSRVIRRLEVSQHRLPRGSVMRKRKADPDKPCIILRPTRNTHGVLPDPFRDQWGFLQKASDAGDRDWLIQDDRLSLKIVYAVLRSTVSNFWFTNTMPPDAALGKARLLDYPMPMELI